MKNLHAIVFSTLLLFSVGLNAQSSITVPFYIIIGQSNTGWASANSMTTQQAASYKGLIANTDVWNPALGASSAIWRPMNVGANTMPENYADPSQFGPEASLFKSLQDQQSRKRLVYKQGQGGTTLAGDWRPPSPGQYMWQAGTRYQQFVEWLGIAVSQANAQGYKLDLKAVIWMQGEDDAKTLADASAYLNNLGGFFTAIENIWKGHINSYGFPNNPYKKIIGRIYAPVAYPYRDLVRSAQGTFCANTSNNAIMINCDAYPLQDWVHYNATGQIQFGLDIYNAAPYETDEVTPATGVSFSGKVLLQGAYNTTTGLMNNTLNISGILQSFANTQPYNNSSFSYNGTESVGAGFYASHTDIVDWILLELRDAAAPATVVARRAAFVKRDGSIVDKDGSSSSIYFEGVARGSYLVSVRHRNHLGIRSVSAVNFSSGSASHDFTTSGAQCYQNQSYHSTVQKGNVWLMRGGNANVNTNVKYNGPQNDQDRIQNMELGGSISLVLNTVYSGDDVNMDGSIKTNGPNNDQNFLLNIILGGSIGTVYNQQL